MHKVAFYMLVVLTLIFSPFDVDAAQMQSLLLGKTPTQIIKGDGSSIMDIFYAIDGNDSTYARIRGSNYSNIIWEFNEPFDVFQYKINVSNGDSSFPIKFILVDGTERTIETRVPYPRSNAYFNYSHPIRGVTKVQISIATGYLFEVDLKGIATDTTPPGDVSNLKAIAGDEEISLQYVLPPDEDFSHVRIYQDDTLIADNIKTSSYTVSGLTNGQKYTFRVTTVDQVGNESDGVTITATPKAQIREVKNLKAEAKHDRVNLSWRLPDSPIDHVTIYRKTLEDTAFSFFGFMPVAYAAEGYVPLFETNGTYFNDLTVQPETSYEYLLTTSYMGKESPGVTVQVTTPAVPPPNMGGIVPSIDENGDYTLKWTPQAGEVIIEVDGQEYARVDAMLGSYTIPAADARDEEGNFRKIRVIPVAPNGTPGKPVVIHPGGYAFVLPFGVRELLESVMELLKVLGPFILLALVLWYVRPIMNLIKRSTTALREGRYRV